jgi:hypothetical protein
MFLVMMVKSRVPLTSRADLKNMALVDPYQAQPSLMVEEIQPSVADRALAPSCVRTTKLNLLVFQIFSSELAAVFEGA